MLSFMPSAGAASARMAAAEITAAITGRRWMTAAHRSAAGLEECPLRPVSPPAGSAAGPGRGRPAARRSRSRDGRASRVPVKPSSAGSRVSEPSTVIATVADAATATPLSSDIRNTSSPSIPIVTVTPAISTLRPAVLIAVTTAVLPGWDDPPGPPRAPSARAGRPAVAAGPGFAVSPAGAIPSSSFLSASRNLVTMNSA